MQFDQLRRHLGKCAPPHLPPPLPLICKPWSNYDRKLWNYCKRGFSLRRSQRLWSDFSFWQVLEKSWCAVAHSKQQPVWEQPETNKFRESKLLCLLHCLEFSKKGAQVLEQPLQCAISRLQKMVDCRLWW